MANGLAAKHFQADCPLAICHWASDPLGTEEAALEARRAHLNAHTHGDLVDHIASMNPNVVQYDKTVIA